VALSSIYHTRVPMCSYGVGDPRERTPPQWSIRCPALHDVPVLHTGGFDAIVPNTDLQTVYDFTPITAKAAAALDRYRAMQHSITPLKNKLSQALRGTSNCPFSEADADAISALAGRMPGAMRALREPGDEIAAACIAAGRSLLWVPYHTLEDYETMWNEPANVWSRKFPSATGR